MGRMISLCLLALAAGAIAEPVSAQQAREQVTIAYRLRNTRTMHFHDAVAAEKHLQTVEKLGCEALRHAHDGHTDVAYRCPAWKPLTIASETVQQWESWLSSAGFETLRGEPAETSDSPASASGPREIVVYRAANWSTQHTSTAGEAEQVQALAKALGCEVRKADHGGHTDVSMRCPEWKQARFASYQAAHDLEQWLKQSGFETRHIH